MQIFSVYSQISERCGETVRTCFLTSVLITGENYVHQNFPKILRKYADIQCL